MPFSKSVAGSKFDLRWVGHPEKIFSHRACTTSKAK
jgi:hypothetical protein